MERSSDQVVRPLYQEALTKWVGQIPDDVINDMANIAPMLATLGYDPAANPPVYGIPEQGIGGGGGGGGGGQQPEQPEQQPQQYDDGNDVSGDTKEPSTVRRRRRRKR